MEEEGVARERPLKAPASENAMDAMSGEALEGGNGSRGRGEEMR